MKFFAYVLGLILVISCSSQGSVFNPGGISDGTDNEDDSEWLIPKEEVIDGGPGKDGIPSIDFPAFVSSQNADFLQDEDLVVVVNFDSDIKVYPHSILDWHEIVNDELNGRSFALTYCPLTGTAINWNRDISGFITTFGVSGLLYNSNLIPYDRRTDSNWSQMRLDCVNGELIENNIETLNALETSWKTIKDLANVQVLSLETGFARNYGSYPYGDYRSNHDNIIFPIGNTDKRLKAKDRVLGIIGFSEAKIYQFDTFSTDSIVLVKDQLDGVPIAVLGNRKMNFLTPFVINSEDEYTAVQKNFPIILQDKKGNMYNIFGKAVSGPDQGKVLKQPTHYIGYWFSWAAFYPKLQIYE